MNKAKLVEEVSSKTRLTKENIRNIIDATTKTIKNALSKGERVTLVDFGTFLVIRKKARRGRNPQTREELQIPARKVPKFRAGKALREKIK